MNKNDFRYMWRGKIVKLVTNENTNNLELIEQRSQQKKHALLVIHGFSSSPHVFRKIIKRLNYDSVISPVLPGHCENIEAFSNATASQWVNECEKVCAQLLDDYDKVDVMGFSLGGVLATHLSSKFSLNHLYLLAPALKLHLNAKAMTYLSKILRQIGFKRLRNRAGNFHTAGELELAYRQLPLSTIIEILNFIDNFAFKPPSCPTDLFLGAYDEVVDSYKVAQCFQSLKNVKIHWLNNSAHVLPLDGDVEQIIECINLNSHDYA